MITCVHHHPGPLVRTQTNTQSSSTVDASPLKSKRSNTVQIRSIAVYKSEFGIVLDTSGYGAEQTAPNEYPLTYAGIRQWIEDNHDIKVSKSSITIVRNKCNALKLDYKAGKEPTTNIIKTQKEKLVLEAFKALGIV